MLWFPLAPGSPSLMEKLLLLPSKGCYITSGFFLDFFFLFRLNDVQTSKFGFSSEFQSFSPRLIIFL